MFTITVMMSSCHVQLGGQCHGTAVGTPPWSPKDLVTCALPASRAWAVPLFGHALGISSQLSNAMTMS